GLATARVLEQAQLTLGQKPSTSSLQALADGAQGILQSQPVGHLAAEASAHILGSLRAKHSFADEHLTSLANDGTLAERARQALETGETRLASRLCALVILKEGDLPDPDGTSWAEFLAAHPEFLVAIDEDIQAYGAKAFLHTVAAL